MHIRHASPEDVTALTVLADQLGYPSSAAQVRERLQRVLVAPEHVVLVACRDDGSMVGWIHVFTTLRIESDRFAELGGLVVDEGSRGQGIGRQLLGAARAWAVEQGVSKLRVRSRSTRLDAHAFYERVGFSRAKVQDVFDQSLPSGSRQPCP